MAVDIWLAARLGILSAGIVVLLAILGCWILVNLFHGEVLRFLMRRSSYDGRGHQAGPRSADSQCSGRM